MRCPVALAAGLLATAAAAQTPLPATFFGRQMGADRFLVPWPEGLPYLQALDVASDRIALTTMGRSTLGQDRPLAIITSPANHT